MQQNEIVIIKICVIRMMLLNTKSFFFKNDIKFIVKLVRKTYKVNY